MKPGDQTQTWLTSDPGRLYVQGENHLQRQRQDPNKKQVASQRDGQITDMTSISGTNADIQTPLSLLT